jgi:hypothetical protein
MFLFAAMALLAGCAKEEIKAPVGDGHSLTITLGQTKTHMDGAAGTSHKIYWSNNDKIAVNGNESDALTGLGDTESTATFHFATPLSGTPYNIVYPASIYKNASTVTLPALQTYKDGGFADGMYPMAGYSADGSSISINHLCAIVKVAVKRSSAGGADTDNLVSVTFRGKADEQVSGDFSINYGTATLTGSSSAAADKEVRVVKNLETSTSEAVVYYIVVPAQNYASGISITVQDVNGDTMTKESGAANLAAGKLYTPAELEFVPSGTASGIEIATADDLVAFATAYNNNEYADLSSSLIVNLAADITFDATSSAAFNATGGIGTNDNGKGDTNYFNGLFNGKDHTISGLEATVPVFAYTGAGGIIKNLTLSSTCTFTVGTSSGSYHAPLVGRNKGTVKDCTSNESIVINNIADVTTASQYYGGLVGYNPGGTIDGCTVTGNITCSQTGQTITANNACIGGIAGYQSSDGGTINNCTYTGNITVSDASTYGGITANGIYFYVAGILGYGNKCVVSNCTAGVDGESKAIDVRGVLVPAIGGIVGWNVNAASSEISDNNNYMSLSFASNGARANTTPSRVGGIIARSAAPISGCQNYGAIATSCNSTTLTIGGIVGESSGASISDCINNSTGTLTRSNADQTGAQANRYMVIGGIAGRLAGAAADFTDCTNNAAITSNVPGTSTALTLDMGGIIGYAEQQIDISGCVNNGAVTNNLGSTTAVFPRLTLGGIIGYGSSANTTVKSCDNKAQIYCNGQSKSDNRCSYSGGVAGLMGTVAAGVAGLEIGNCTNTARVWNRNYNTVYNDATKTPFGGGIVGAIIGTDGSKANVHDCTTSTNDVVQLRGFSGGIAGYVKDASLSTNSAAQALTGSNKNSEGIGGIVGWAVASSISGCSYAGAINAVKNIGGLVCILDGTSSLTSSNANGVTLTKGDLDSATDPAVLVSNAASGATITSCGVKGTIDGGAITLESRMITTDGGATITGTTLIP